MKIRIIALAVSLLTIACGNSQDSQKDQGENNQEAKEEVWCFIMAGQSNMAGRGRVTTRDTVTHKRIITLNAKGEWVPAKEPLHYYEPKRQGLDCGMSFARELLNYVPENVSIAMIPCAVGASSISQWLGDSLHRGVQLYSNIEEKLELAQKKGTIKAILWMQGESDANPDGVASYEDKLRALIEKMRASAGQDDLPILLGELGHFAQDEERIKYREVISDITLKVSESTDNTAFVKVAGLSPKDDNVHFNSASLRELGRRYAIAYIDFIDQPN